LWQIEVTWSLAITGIDIWRLANEMMKIYGKDAEFKAGFIDIIKSEAV
jgi:hypothetical protein